MKIVVREFKFKSTVEKLRINGNDYEIDFADDKIKQYQKELEQFYFKSKEVQEVDADNLSAEEQQKYLDKTKELATSIIDALLGEGAFEELYEESGKSLINMVDLIEFLTEVIGEKSTKTKQEKYDKLLKAKKKRK